MQQIEFWGRNKDGKMVQLRQVDVRAVVWRGSSIILQGGDWQHFDRLISERPLGTVMITAWDVQRMDERVIWAR